MANFFTAAAVVGAVTDNIARVAVKGAKSIQSKIGPKSLTRASKDSIFQMPMIFSGDIDTDEITVIAKAAEKNNAALMISWLSLEGRVNRAKYNTIADFLKTFHTNTATPELIANNFVLESADGPATESVTFDKDTIMSMWEIASEQLDPESLNSMYQPYQQTKYVLESALCNMKIATEAKMSADVNQFYTEHPKLQEAKNIINNNTIIQSNDTAFANMVQKTAAAAAAAAARNGSKSGGKNDAAVTVLDLKSGGNAIMIDDRLASLPPTMISVNLVNYDTTNGSNVVWNQNVVLGVKSMIRIVRSNIMIANMIEACKSYMAFKLIQWTKHEIRANDILFGTKEWKDMAIPTASNRWLKALEARRRSNKYTKFIPGMKRLLPNTTIIMTEGEAIQVFDACHVDLHDAGAAKKVIDKYLILGIGIYNTETKILDMFYDGDNAFSSTSIRQLTALMRKDTNLLTESY